MGVWGRSWDILPPPCCLRIHLNSVGLFLTLVYDQITYCGIINGKREKNNSLTSIPSLVSTLFLSIMLYNWIQLYNMIDKNRVPWNCHLKFPIIKEKHRKAKNVQSFIVYLRPDFQSCSFSSVQGLEVFCRDSSSGPD